jgi:predicted DNA-binding transcriptional regulator AlpA
MTQQIKPSANDEFLPAARVRARYGVSSMSIERWLQNAKLNFPRPMYIGRYRYWRLADLAEWERARASGKGA